MLTLRKALSTFIISLLGTLAAASVATATSVIIPSDDEMIIGARAIVRGTVTTVSSAYDEPHHAIFTYVTLQISEVLKGQFAENEIVLQEPGGVTSEGASTIFGTPEFQVGEDVLVYLDTWADGSLRVHQWFLGKYSISAGEVPGKHLIKRALGGEKVSILGRSPKGNITNQAELGDYLALLRARVAALRQESAQHEIKYYSRVMMRATPPEMRAPLGQPQNFTLFNPSYPVRWFEPDAGRPVSFKINLEGAPSSAVMDDIQAAMNAWSSVSGSALRVVSGGTTNGCGLLTADGENTISFNNCDNYSAFSPPGGSGCSGVLAAAGIIRFVFMTRVINGTTFYQATEGNLAFNPYAACRFNSSCNVREITTHEMGHALGLGHSADATATMSAVLHFDGRCAGLRADDQEGIRFLYPATGVAAPPSLALSTTALTGGRVGEAYWQQLAATGGTPPYIWSLQNSTLPAGLIFEPLGLIGGMPTASGAYRITLRVTDSVGSSAQADLTLTITGTTTPPPLAISTTSLPNAQVGVFYSHPLSATGGTAPHQWSVVESALPAGLSLGAGGLISGTPAASGATSFTCRVADSAGQTAQSRLSLTVVAAPPPALLISTATLANAQVGVAYAQSLSATGGTTPYTWSLVGGALPAGLNLSANGVVSGAPAASGAFNLTVLVTDAAAQSARVNLSLAVAEAPPPAPPPLAITTTTLPQARSGVLYAQTLSATGGTSPYTWSLDSSSLPGLTMNADGIISGTPFTTGVFSFTVRVTDRAGQSAQSTLWLSVVEPAWPLTIATATLPTASMGRAYTAAFNAGGGTGPYTWSLADGLLPPGLTITESGLLKGTPMRNGTFSFLVRVTGANGESTEKSLSLRVSL